MSEVGHTHNEVDQQFGVLANALSHNKIYSPQGLAKLTEKTLSGVVATSMAPPTYDFKSILKEIENPSGKIKSNHFFEISKDEDGNVILKIARFMRSRTFLANDPRAADPCSFKMFKQKPDITKFQTLVLPKKFDLYKYAQLCAAVKGRIPPEEYTDLLNVPNYLKNLPPSESFESLLKRLEENVIVAPPTAEISHDPENIAIDAFLKSDVVIRIWNSVDGCATDVLQSDKNLKGEKASSSKIKEKTTRKSASQRPVIEKNSVKGKKRKQPDP